MLEASAAEAEPTEKVRERPVTGGGAVGQRTRLRTPAPGFYCSCLEWAPAPASVRRRPVLLAAPAAVCWRRRLRLRPSGGRGSGAGFWPRPAGEVAEVGP